MRVLDRSITVRFLEDEVHEIMAALERSETEEAMDGADKMFYETLSQFTKCVQDA